MFHVLLLSLIGLTPSKESFDFNFSRQHDKGMYLRLEAGLGYANLRTTAGASEGTKKGFGFTHSASLGLLIKNRLALHVTEFGLLSGDAIRQGVGPGVTYYISDSFFSSVSIGPTIGTDHENGIQYSLAGELSLGLMGWVSEDSQLGIIAHINGETVDVDGDATLQSGWRIGLRFGYSFH